MMNRTRLLALTALAGLASLAYAGGPNEDTPSPVVKGQHRTINVNPDGSGNTRSLHVVTVYDTMDIDATGVPAYTGLTSASPYFGEWGTLRLPRTGVGNLGTFYQTVEEVTFGLSAVTATQLNDVVITFWDNPRMWEVGGTAGTGGFQASSTTVLGSFKVVLPQETSQFGTFDIWTITGLSALSSPINLSDNFFGITIDTYVQGTNTRDGQIYNIFNVDENGPIIGWSEDRFARDVSGDGIIPETECNRVFTGNSNPANLFLQINVNFCDSDFDGSGFSDTDDFDAMVQAYEAGC